LLRVSDVLLYDTPHPEFEELAFPKYRFQFSTKLRQVRSPEGELVELSSLAGRRFGLLTTIARPERVTQKLREAGVEPAVRVAYADHSRPRRLPAPAPALEGWLVTPKCASNLTPRLESAPIWILEPETNLPNDLIDLVWQRIRARLGSQSAD
jgi:tetraacyldisaccharide-1-P 4'-kinase